MLRYLFFFGLVFLTLSCEQQESDSRSVDEANLALLYQRILEQTDTACSDPEEWNFVAIGEKACGGPKNYIPYPNSIDTDAFLKLVEQYNEADRAFNIKYDIMSDCRHMMPPRAIVCEDGKARLVYSSE